MKILLIIGLCFTVYSVIIWLFDILLIEIATSMHTIHASKELYKFEEGLETATFICFILGLCLTATWGIIKLVNI